MNFGNVKRKRASLREIHLPSILIRYTYTFKVLYKKSFNISKKKKKKSPSDPKLANCFSLVYPRPFFRFDSISRPAKKINLSPRSNNLHETSQRVQAPNLKVATTPCIPLPFQFPKLRQQPCSTTDQLRNRSLSSSPRSSRGKERERKEEKKRGRLHARPTERGNEGPRGVATRQPDRYLHERYARGRWRRQ